ncbi:hypothetical protein L249_6424 [Ophiocordyceps polyrhachis-furcata BCC 54312]|uniref:Large ribosomal subunit protein mL43 n=1 Tax=Ophiocordyceps polyrhachis-furcata BCC 54312 TaxID=1330021 RepID=A0A367LL56_9HYPO|nr:hypothetical protein L249_6424 [Ophiocordyceps polyrhachis-furcata BCC 54312]
MTVKALRAVASGKNGIGAFILQCKRMDLHYCDSSGSSQGMKGFIKSLLPKFASVNSQIEFVISPRPNKHPVIVGHYINGRTKPICVRNLSPYEILQKVELLRDASGDKLRRTNKAVMSTNPGVRGIWSPYHGSGMAV